MYSWDEIRQYARVFKLKHRLMLSGLVDVRFILKKLLV